MPFVSKEISRLFTTSCLCLRRGCRDRRIRLPDTRMERENYQRACDKLGIKSRTPTYDECMLKQQRMDNDDIQRP